MHDLAGYSDQREIVYPVPAAAASYKAGSKERLFKIQIVDKFE
ncbi:MAG: hypothetical protein Q4D77_02145 [Peptostreptococcaceae bacterium]|nr:hypothetical protein [Peptostreptococcaceae bacterium]